MLEKYTRSNGSIGVRTSGFEPTRTQQQFKDECDINNIINKYNDTGEFTHLTSKQGIYADFSHITNYGEMLNQTIRAKEAFVSLPSKIRSRFNNDPGLLLQFLQDPKNRDEALALKLINAPVSQANVNASNVNTNAPTPLANNKKTKITTITEDL